MSDNTEKLFDQVAAFQKLWMDSFADIAGVWSQFSAGSPPIDEMRKMRGGKPDTSCGQDLLQSVSAAKGARRFD